MTFFITEADLAPGATKDDALKVVWELQGLGWEVQYGEGINWKEALANDPGELAAFEQDLKQVAG